MKQYKILISVVAIFYLVGCISAFTPLKDLVFLTTPLVILLTLIAYLKAIAVEKKSIYIIGIAGVIGYFVEVIGVATGFPFGDYSYGKGLGLQLMNVPLVLIANWSLLTIISLYSTINAPKWVQYSLPPILITVLDVLIEPVAIHYDWWTWSAVKIPLTNYVGWLIVAFFVNLLLIRFLNTDHHHHKKVLISRTFLIIQFIFFGTVNLSLC